MTENQLVVLQWLKDTFTARKVNMWFAFDVLESISSQYNALSFEELESPEKPHLKAFGELTQLEGFEVISAFAEWGIQEVSGK